MKTSVSARDASILDQEKKKKNPYGMVKLNAGLLRRDIETWVGLVVIVTLVSAVLRFMQLEVSPPGFFADESAISTQVICLRQTGADAHGTKWPLFSPVLNEGIATPTYLYSGVIWTSIFGDSIASFRAMAAFFGCLTMLGIWFLALKLWRSHEAAWLSALCVGISPWAFQFSRIAWDPAVAPCFFVWGLVLLLSEGKRFREYAIAGGLLVAASLYAYPPFRVQAMIVLPLAFFLIRLDGRFAQGLRVRFAAFSGAILLAIIPLAEMTFTGEIQSRFNMLAIWNEGHLEQFGGFSLSRVVGIFFENIGLHLSPTYLFLSGDTSLRHSTQAVGLWSWVEILAMAALPYVLINRGLYKAKSERRVLAFAVVSYFAGILPAALTWESNPHSLRSIGAYPFLALAAGGLLFHLGRTIRAARIVIAVTAVAFLTWYVPEYFVHYPKRATDWFDQAILERVNRIHQEGRLENLSAELKAMNPDYPDLSIRYFQLALGAQTCSNP